MSRAIDIGGLVVSETETSAGLRFDTPVPSGCVIFGPEGEGPLVSLSHDRNETYTSRELTRHQVEELREVCDDFLAGRRL